MGVWLWVVGIGESKVASSVQLWMIKQNIVFELLRFLRGQQVIKSHFERGELVRVIMYEMGESRAFVTWLVGSSLVNRLSLIHI